MLGVFCLRLACGMIAALLAFSPRLVNQRFYRVHFLTGLGLTTAAAMLFRDLAWPGQWLCLGLALGLLFVGSVVWSLDRAPGGMSVIVLTAAVLAVTACTAAYARTPAQGWPWLLLGELTSAAFLGSAVTAMLMGHSYLIAPAMSLSPLLRLLAAFSAMALVRMAVAGAGLWFWTAGRPGVTLEGDALLWLPVRWGVGLVGPLVLAWMAWQAARIRSTQSATGILYVLVIFGFLGELTGQLLSGDTGLVL